MVDDITGRRDVPLDVERNIYTYNQGTTLAVLLTLAESSEISDDRREEYLLRAERLDRRNRQKPQRRFRVLRRFTPPRTPFR